MRTNQNITVCNIYTHKKKTHLKKNGKKQQKKTRYTYGIFVIKDTINLTIKRKLKKSEIKLGRI